MIDFSCFKRRRLAILGIGNEWMGDDAAGLLVARGVFDKSHPPADNYLIIETGPAPENFTSQLRRFKPEVVILVDAAQMGLPPGSIQLLDWRDAHGWGGSTHTLPLSTLVKFISLEMGCEVYVLGIQPKTIEPEEPVSKEVADSVASVIQLLHATIHSG